MALANYSYIGKGPVYGRDRNATEGALPFGNCSNLNFAVETSEITQPDYTQAGGGLANKIDRIDSVNVNLTMLDLAPRNMAIALRGTTTELAGGVTVTGETHTANPNALIAFDFLPDASQTITVTLDPGGSATTLSEGQDYTVTRAGIVIAESGTVTGGETIGVDYTKAAQSIIEAMTESAAEFELIFDGLNEAQSGKAVSVKVHRLKFAPTTGLDLIGDEFAELQLEGTALLDTAITGNNLSQYFKVLTEAVA